MFSLFALFGGSIAGWLGHALYIRPAQLKGAPAPIAKVVTTVEDGIVAPAAVSIAQQELNHLASPAAATPLPKASAIGSAVGSAALAAVVADLDPDADGDPNAPPAPQ